MKQMKLSVRRLPASPLQERKNRRTIKVFNCRLKNAPEKVFETSEMDYNDFRQALHKEFAIQLHETFVLTTTDRTVLDFDKFAMLQDGCTLYLLQQEDQTLAAAVEEQIMFQPHYDTLIRSGMYEYYASNSQKSLPYALAELIDNALSATAKNAGVRTIEIRMMFDETLGKPAVIVLDNGCGMTSKQLTNWAVYRLSKFASKEEGYVRPDPVPRSLNSDISYFGVGGKQAVFYIGDSTRMITKPVGSPDVHELVVSKEDFEKKERNKEDIYSGTIRNRKPGDSSHVNKDDRFLHALIAEESGKESFTAVVITGVLPEHIGFLKHDFDAWTRQLAHIYHYYIHGLDGNVMNSSSTNSDDRSKIDIQVTLREKPPKCPCVMNLREVENDLQTLYINAAADTFEFKVSTEDNSGTVEGILRYHPFLYDKETYPREPDTTPQAPLVDEDDDNESADLHQARGKRPIFECFWNGRLIPYTTVSEFEWCAQPKVKSKLPAECYSRFSGVLFTDDGFTVSTNKLTFMELELKLKDKNTIFTHVVNGQNLRGNIKMEFTKWLQNCHANLDKQVQFLDYQETITRPEVTTKKMQHPWATFSSIEWDGKKYETGQLVKSQKTQRNIYGRVVRFLLYGNYDGDVFATGGQVEVEVEPKELYDTTKTIPISKIDRNATDDAIKKNIESDRAKLPAKLKVDWVEGVRWHQKAVRPAGTPLGPIKVEILNKKEESISRMPPVDQKTVRKLSVRLQIIRHDPKGDQEFASFVAQHISKHGSFWFKKMENLTDLGSYTLSLNAMVNESTDVGDKQLPSYRLSFTIKEGSAQSFTVGAVNTTLHVGAPFDIPLQIKDAYGNLTAPPPEVKPVLVCSGLDVCYKAVDCSGTMFTIRGVKARGKVQNYQQSKTYDLKVTLHGLKADSQTLKISLLPGKPHSLRVAPKDDPITVENGKAVAFNVEIHDEAGNITAHPKHIVHCKVPSLPPMEIDCSSTGAGHIVTKPINLKIIKGEPQQLKVQFDVIGWKNITSVVRELKVLPSTRISQMKLCSQNDENLVLKNNEKVEWLAGSSLECLFYRLYNEAGREVSLTAEIASKIKVTWTTDANIADLVRGKLPAVQVPTQVQEERFHQVFYQDQSVSVSFTVTPRPDEPTQLKATPSQITLKLGETLPGNINLELVDQYDNVTKTLNSTCIKNITVDAEGLDMSALAFTWQESSGSVVVLGVCFKSGTPGFREMCFTYRSYVGHVKVKVTAGDPAELKLVSGPKQPLQVLNDHGIPTSFLIQLCDGWGNPSSDQRVVVVFKSSNPALKMMTTVTSQPVNTDGRATFTVKNVSGPKGNYQLDFKGFFNTKPILGPSVSLTVIPDSNKPVKLSVNYDDNATFPAGGVFPLFSVTVVSDEGSPITTLNPADVSMFLWKGTSSGNTPPQTAFELKCSKPRSDETKGCFRFRDKEIPEQGGKYTIQFSLHLDKTKVLFGDQIPINVVANRPVKLGPDSEPPTPVVSYTKVIANRTLVENMTLRIMDSYGNPAGQNLDGKVVVSIQNSGDNNNNKSLPLFEGKTSRVQYSLQEGKTQITKLAIMENSPGEDGSVYVLIFKPEVSMVQTSLAAFELPFYFYNDVENQRTMSELSKKKRELAENVDACKDAFALNKDLLRELTSHLMDSSKKVDDLRKELKKNMNIEVSVYILSVDQLLKEKTAEIERIRSLQRRVCSIPDQFREQQDVLGMVGHLAFVQDDDAARVISWHIRGEMDCVITKTTSAARRIYDLTQGRQQVMALDSVFVPTGNRPLPHIRNGHALFDPPGNPVYARELLMYPRDEANCDIVFRNILGDTILIDDLDSANSYRKAVVQTKTPCPTILTRRGERISRIGKFGGAQNKAPPIQALQVFGAPFPQDYHTLKEQIDLLSQYTSALKKKVDAQKECEDHLKVMKSPEMLRRQQEVKEKEKQLEEIERQLMSTPVRPVKRRPEDVGEPSGIISKRTKHWPR
ncbi:hypothetical protein PAMA_008462 [Pampus argenteus]